MQNSDRSTRLLQALVRMLARAERLALRWLPLAAPLALALGIGSTYQARLVQAQDGSGRRRLLLTNSK